MNTRALSKIITVLIIILVLSIIGLVVVSILKGNEDNPEDTDTSEVTDSVTTIAEATTDDETTAEVTTKTDDTTKADETTKTDDTTKVADETTKEDETTKAKQSAPANFTYSATLTGDSGTKYLKTQAVITGTANEDGTVHLVVTFNLIHYDIYAGGIKNCYIKVGGNGSTFTSPSFKQETTEGKQKQTTDLIGTYECDVYYGEKVTVSAYYGFTGTYGKTEVAGILIDSSITVK